MQSCIRQRCKRSYIIFVEKRIWYLHDALFPTKKLDSFSLKQLPMVDLQVMNLLFLIIPCWFLGLDALAVGQLVGMPTFAVALAIKPNTYNAAALQGVGCNREFVANFLPYLQCLGRCLMHQLRTYTLEDVP